MLTQELSLFNIPETSQPKKKQPLRSEKSYSYTPSPYKAVEDALLNIFPTSSEESKVLKTKKLLGEVALELQNEQIETLTNEFQYLVDTWLDSFEKDTFQGKTLKEILGGK